MSPTDILKRELSRLTLSKLSLTNEAQTTDLNNLIKHIGETISNIETRINAANYYYSELSSTAKDIINLGHAMHECVKDGPILPIIEPLYNHMNNPSTEWYRNFQIVDETCFELAFQISANLPLLEKFEKPLFSLMSLNSMYSLCLLDDIRIKRLINMQIERELTKIKEFEERNTL